jgi:predicted transcriptional regulator/DNA-binding ferritin-like protein (Dps family)
MQNSINLQEEIKKAASKTQERIFIIDLDLPSEGRFASRIPVYLTITTPDGEEITEKIGDEIIYFLDKELRNELKTLNERVRTEIERHSAKLKSGMYVTTEGGVSRISSIIEEYKPKYRELEEKITEAILNKQNEYISKTIEYISQKEGRIRVKGLVDGVKLLIFPVDVHVEGFIEKAVKELCEQTITHAAERLVRETKERLDELAEKLKNARYVVHLPTVREALEKEIQALQNLAQELGVEIDERKRYLIREFHRLTTRFTNKVLNGIDSGRAAALIKKLSEYNHHPTEVNKNELA